MFSYVLSTIFGAIVSGVLESSRDIVSFLTRDMEKETKVLLASLSISALVLACMVTVAFSGEVFVIVPALMALAAFILSQGMIEVLAE